MSNIQEIVSYLQSRISEYRKESRKIARFKGTFQQGRNLLEQIREELIACTTHSLKALRTQMEESVYKISDFFEGLIQKQKRGYEREIIELRSEIERQYKVIGNMRQEVQDLQQLIIFQNTSKQQQTGQSQYYEREKECHHERVECRPQIPKLATAYVLQVIEQETQRTVQSSVHSFQDNEIQRTQKFIRIEQKSYEESQQFDQAYSLNNNECNEQSLAKSQLYPKAEDYDECFSGQSRTSLKQQMNLQSSAFSRRQKTYQQGENSEQPFEKYDSLPLGEGYITGEFNREDNFFDIRGEKHSKKELREITNIMNQCSSEEERQSKTKMFLDQFRKTFNKCLSSANISRKNSGKQTGKKNKSREDKRKSSRQKLNTPGKFQIQRSSDSQRNFHEMYKETCNSKFSIGTKREQLKYQGDRKQGNKHGNGHLIYSNGLVFEGEFRQNQRHGYGILKFNAIEIYRGQWQNDELSGQGKIRNFAVINRAKNLASSSPLLKWVSYCGYFKNNRFEGEGTLYLQGGEKFLGKFICGSACGQGTLFRKNGEIQTGIWRSNQLVEKF